MTSDDRRLLILRRLDEIERKLDHMLDELGFAAVPAVPRSGTIHGTPFVVVSGWCDPAPLTARPCPCSQRRRGHSSPEPLRTF
jgi:hypothetical protein